MNTEQNTVNDSGGIITEDQLNTGMDHENDSNTSHIHETREKLKALSISVRDLVKQGKYESINEAIMATVYKDEENQEFKSYRQWGEDGFQVRKGEHAYALWGRPKEHEEDKDAPEKTGGEMEDDHGKFFPIAYVFSNKQVDPIVKKQEEPEKESMEELANIRGGKARETVEMEK
jgi:antirestriction protein ArdC